MVNIKDAATEKLGPLPVAVWVGVPLGGYVVYKWWRHKNSDTPVIATADGSLPDYASGDVGTASDFSDGYGNAAGSYYSAGGSAVDTYAPPALQDNQDWARQATNFLIAAGINPITAQRAISAFIYGSSDTVNTEENAALQWALRQFGTPPEPVTTMPTLYDPPPSTTPTAPNTPTQPTQPAPTPQPVFGAPTLVNFGNPGQEGWTAFVFDQGRLRWITDGNVYQSLVNQGYKQTNITDPRQQTAYLNRVATQGEMPFTLSGDAASAWRAGLTRPAGAV